MRRTILDTGKWITKLIEKYKTVFYSYFSQACHHLNVFRFVFFLSTNRKKSKGEQQHLVALTSTGIVWSALDSKYVECRNAHNIYAEIEMSDISVSILDEVMQWCKCSKILYSK